MDREEAIKRIQQDLDVNKKYLCKEYKEALQMAIGSLSAEPTDLISRADAIAKAKYLVNRWIGVTGKAYEEKVPLIEEVFNAIPSAKLPTKCITEIKTDADEVAQKIKEKYDLADRPSVAYICDGMACGGDCDECHHTTDIKHAKNFKCVDGKYIETDDSQSWEWSFIGDNLYECTCCGVAYTPGQLKATTIKKGQFAPNYCPNCGAKMGGKHND